MRNRHVEGKNSALQRLNALREPFLESRSPSAFFGSNPVRKLGYDDAACVTIILFPFQPVDHWNAPIFLYGLAQNIRIEQPAHSLIFFGYSLFLAGTSSINTGHSLHTFSHFV